MIKTLYEKDSSKWQKTNLKHFKNLMETLCYPVQNKESENGDDKEKEALSIDPYVILTRKDYLGRIPIYHAITKGANKYVIDYIKNIMIEGGVNEQFLDNIIGNFTPKNTSAGPKNTNGDSYAVMHTALVLLERFYIHVSGGRVSGGTSTLSGTLFFEKLSRDKSLINRRSKHRVGK